MRIAAPAMPESCCWWTTAEGVAANDYNLAAGRYKPRIAERPPEENLARLIRETLALEREIVTRLEKLLKEIEHDQGQEIRDTVA